MLRPHTRPASSPPAPQAEGDQGDPRFLADGSPQGCEERQGWCSLTAQLRDSCQGIKKPLDEGSAQQAVFSARACRSPSHEECSVSVALASAAGACAHANASARHPRGSWLTCIWLPQLNRVLAARAPPRAQVNKVKGVTKFKIRCSKVRRRRRGASHPKAPLAAAHGRSHHRSRTASPHPQYLYTLTVKDQEKADKLKQSLPPGAYGSAAATRGFGSHNLWSRIFHSHGHSRPPTRRPGAN